MYSITKKDYGWLLVFGDSISEVEMMKWVEESKKVLAMGSKKDFGVFVDMRTLKPLAQSTKDIMVKGQMLFKQAGMVRSVVILQSAVITMQFKRIAKESGIDAWERYISAETTPDWQKKGEEWLKSGKDPD
ncbi:hypothetical protein KKF34_03505 [Myxococcota bacterium]|nr:hypothetical protein [Myxococcota bacterium]MBU1382142.1 hypothetical protein [Myxococcota bacterium]MBU1495923.1 hypothetical protein [Myxococcota bacterium]